MKSIDWGWCLHRDECVLVSLRVWFVAKGPNLLWHCFIPVDDGEEALDVASHLIVWQLNNQPLARGGSSAGLKHVSEAPPTQSHDQQQPPNGEAQAPQAGPAT